MSSHSPTGSFSLEKVRDIHVEDASQAEALATQIDPKLERKVRFKLDCILLTSCCALFLFMFLDRANIGNARIAGMEEDLNLAPGQFNIALTVFYVFYATFEAASGPIARRLSLRYYIPGQAVIFGLICTCTGLVTNFGQLVAVRVLLGIAESGMQPSLALCLGRFYRRHELVLRVNLLLGAAIASGAFGGLLASGFLYAGSVGTQALPDGQAWRTIFFGEGVITMAVGLLGFLVIPNSIESAWWLNKEEKACAMMRMKADKGGTHDVDNKAKWRLYKQALLAPHNWLCAFAYLFANITVQGVSLFLPTILRQIYPERTTIQIQLLSVPPYVVGFAVNIFFAWLISRTNKRTIVVALTPLAIIGYAIFVSVQNAEVLYFAAFMAMMGVFLTGPTIYAWSVNCSATDAERAISASFVPGFGQLGAIIATWSYIGTDMITGHKINLGANVATWACTIGLSIYTRAENKKRAAGKRDYRLATVPAGEDPDAFLGSSHPHWVMPT